VYTLGGGGGGTPKRKEGEGWRVGGGGVGELPNEKDGVLIAN